MAKCPGIIDIYSRKILSWRLSNTQDKYFCLEALNEAIAKYVGPEIFNMDQGSQFFSKDFISKFISAGIQISMIGKGRAK